MRRTYCAPRTSRIGLAWRQTPPVRSPRAALPRALLPSSDPKCVCTAGRRDAAAARGEEPADREENAGGDPGATGAQSHEHRADRAEGSHGHQGPQDQRSATQGEYHGLRNRACPGNASQNRPLDRFQRVSVASRPRSFSRSRGLVVVVVVVGRDSSRFTTDDDGFARGGAREDRTGYGGKTTKRIAPEREFDCRARRRSIPSGETRTLITGLPDRNQPAGENPPRGAESDGIVVNSDGISDGSVFAESTMSCGLLTLFTRVIPSRQPFRLNRERSSVADGIRRTSLVVSRVN